MAVVVLVCHSAGGEVGVGGEGSGCVSGRTAQSEQRLLSVVER